ncbi:MAG: prolyl oligopeptidase family serine peptidase [Pirellulaceae bacterium]
MFRRFPFSLLTLVAAMTATSRAADPDHRDRFQEQTFEAAGHKLLYRRLSPQKVEPGVKYPLVVFLHGAGERGADNQKQLVHGMNDFAQDAMMAKYPAFVIAPQCPEGKKWVEVDWTHDAHTTPQEPSEPLAATLALIDDLLKSEPIDKSRVYITGLSMGGYGTWDALERRPELFAAAAPICGGGDPAGVAKYKDVPIWAFHGDKDTAVKPHRSREMIAALKAAGGQPKYTEYAGVGHNSWAPTYSDPALYE